VTVTYWFAFMFLLGWIGVACVCAALLGAAAGRLKR
jgi:hypothetical protein